MGFEVGDKLLTNTRLYEISLSQQEAKGLSGYRLKVGLFGHLGSCRRALGVLSDFRMVGLPRLSMVIRTVRYLELGQGFGTKR